MCGLCGFINKAKKEEKEKIIAEMASKIIHRGPDSEGIYADNNIAVAFRRLSIIDLAGGSQPIFNEDNTKFIFLEIVSSKNIYLSTMFCKTIFLSFNALLTNNNLS